MTEPRYAFDKGGEVRGTRYCNSLFESGLCEGPRCVRDFGLVEIRTRLERATGGSIARFRRHAVHHAGC